MTSSSQPPPDGAALRRRAAGVLSASAVRRGGFDELIVRGQGAAGSERTRAFQAAMRDAGVLLPLSPLTACHVCLATSADDIDEMVAAAAYAFRQHTSQTRRKSP